MRDLTPIERAQLEATEKERQRCIAVIESQRLLAGGDPLVASLLIRIINLIDSGAEPDESFEFDPFGD